MTESVFLNGTYHQMFGDELQHPPYTPALHRKNLLDSYAFSFKMIQARGWESPLHCLEPNVLQLGTASYHTSKTFVDFVHALNPRAQISIVDIAPHPLTECADQGLDQENNVNLRQADARTLLAIYPKDTFDHIETDGLFQFLSADDKRIVLSQCFAVLKPGGVLTTRDRFTPRNADVSTQNEYETWQSSLERRLWATVYPSTKEDMWDLLGKTGFSRTMARRTMQNALKFLNHIVARKPTSKLRSTSTENR